MKTLVKLADSYVFTERDVDAGWDIVAREFGPGPKVQRKIVTDAERKLSDMCLQAERMFRENHGWPTVAEVCQQLEREREEWNRRNPGYEHCWK
jgi:hypothetical protein